MAVDPWPDLGYRVGPMTTTPEVKEELHPPPGATFALAKLLVETFTVQEFEHFLLEHYEDLLRILPRETNTVYYFDSAALALFRRGLVDSDFRQRLLRVARRKPRRGLRVENEFRAWGTAYPRFQYDQKKATRAKLVLTFE